MYDIYRFRIVIFTLLVVACSVCAQDEIIGDESAYTAEKETSSSGKTGIDNGFERGSIVVNAGLMYGSSLIGGEFEFGVAKRLGIQAGFGVLGANAGIRLHPFSRKHLDMYLSATGNYMPALSAVLPALNFNMRGYFGGSARVGIGGMIGVAMCTARRTLETMGTTIEYYPGQLMLTYALGVPIKIRRGYASSADRFR